MIALILFAAFAPAPPAAGPGVQIEQVDETTFLLSLPADGAAEAGQLQTRLAPAATQACRSGRAVLGRYRFSGETNKQRFEQELFCLPPSRELDVVAAARSGGELTPSRADQQAVLAASYAYFTAKDQGRYPQAHRFLAERTRARFPLADWASAARDFSSEAGAPRGRRVVEITWYNNPEDAPEPGLYVAADFSAEFEKAEFVCGYLMWRVLPDGSFALMREEQNMAPRRSSGRALAAIDRDPLRSRMGCKD